jgi:sporulation transcriptional regulator SpoIIID
MSVSDWSGRARCVVLGEYLAEKKTTVRQAAAVFGVSKSTVHKDVTETLRFVNRPLWEEVRRVLLQNKEERHLRGGEATRIKYSALHGRGKE